MTKCSSCISPARLTAAALAVVALASCGGSGASGNGGEDASAIAVAFSATNPDAAPFPSDRYTLADANQLTLRRVALPKSNCTVQVSDCQDIDELNTYDGFSVTPRFTVPFTGDIDPTTVTSDSVYLLRVGGPQGFALAEKSGINQVAWDAPSRMLSFKSDELLRESSRYLLVITDRVKDTAGRALGGAGWIDAESGLPIGAAGEAGDYRGLLRQALQLAPKDAGKPVAATLFTTQTATAELAAMVKQVKARTATGLDFAIASQAGAKVRAVFDAAQVTAAVFKRQNSTGTALTNSNLALASLQAVPGAVGQIAYATYQAPRYMLTNDARIPPQGTAHAPVALGQHTLTAQIFVPAGPKPAGGWPVVIYGHGFGDSMLGSPWQVASVMASYGLATASIHVVGHGGGALGNVTMTLADGSTVDVPLPGRAVDTNGDGAFSTTEGSTPPVPYGVIGARDALRQTVVDISELARRFKAGVDLDGDGAPDFNGAKVNYAGQSFGGVYGTMLLAVDPDLQAGVPNVGGGSLIEATRNGAFKTPIRVPSLAGRTPSLLNLPNSYDDNQPFRNQPVLTKHVDGALAIAKSFDNSEWAQQPGAGTVYAPLLRLRPLAGHAPKPIIYQLAKGDTVMTNPSSGWVVRGGQLSDRVSFYRHDLAVAANAAVGSNPHGFLANLNGAALPIALQAQRQMGAFLASGGVTFEDADGAAPIFENGVDVRILDVLNF